MRYLHNRWQTDTAESVPKSAGEEDLLSLFDQYSNLMSPTMAWPSTGISTVLNEASSEGIGAEYPNYSSTMNNNSTVWHRCLHVGHIINVFFNSFAQKPELLKPNTCTVTAASGTDLVSLGHCYLTFKLGNKYVMDEFIVLWDFLKRFDIRTKLAIQLQLDVIGTVMNISTWHIKVTTCVPVYLQK